MQYASDAKLRAKQGSRDPLRVQHGVDDDKSKTEYWIVRDDERVHHVHEGAQGFTHCEVLVGDLWFSIGVVTSGNPLKMYLAPILGVDGPGRLRLDLSAAQEVSVTEIPEPRFRHVTQVREIFWVLHPNLDPGKRVTHEVALGKTISEPTQEQFSAWNTFVHGLRKSARFTPGLNRQLLLLE